MTARPREMLNQRHDRGPRRSISIASMEARLANNAQTTAVAQPARLGECHSERETVMKRFTPIALAMGIALTAAVAQAQPGPGPPGGPGGPGGRHGRGHPPFSSLRMALDANTNGMLEADEIANAPAALLKPDENGDGKLSASELMPRFSGRTNQVQFAPHAGGKRPVPPILAALDTNGDGELDATEIANASGSLLKLDLNGDGQLTRDELRPARGGGPVGPGGPDGQPGPGGPNGTEAGGPAAPPADQ